MAVLQAPGPDKKVPAADEGKIRRLLGSDDNLGVEPGEFDKAGVYSPAAFPLYARILDDPEESSYLVQRTFLALAKIEGDRRQFLERAVAKLADRHPSVRRTAVQLLAQIGSARDAAPVVALL